VQQQGSEDGVAVLLQEIAQAFAVVVARIGGRFHLYGEEPALPCDDEVDFLTARGAPVQYDKR
jgi:hypothetical protein